VTKTAAMETIFQLDKQCRDEMEVFRDHYLTIDRMRKDILKNENANNNDAFEGRGLDEYFREYEQDGSGLSDFFRGLYRAFEPAVKPAGKYLLKRAFRTGVTTLSDVAQGQNWKAAVKRRLGEAGDEIADEVRSKISRMAGEGYDEGFDDYDHEYSSNVDEAYKKSGVRASEHPSCSSRENVRSEAERQLFSLRPPPVREGRVSARVKKETKEAKKKKKKTTASKRKQIKKKKTVVTRRKESRQSHQRGSGSGGFYD
jgi:hypothetical protein